MLVHTSRIISQAIALIPEIPLNKDGRDINGNIASNLVRQTKVALAKAKGIRYYRDLPFTATLELEAAIRARRIELNPKLTSE